MTAPKIRLTHCFADAVHQEPSRFEADPEHPMQLMRAHPLFRGGKQVHRLEPDMQPDLAALHDGADRHGELLPARVALVDAGAMRLTQQLGYALAEGTAVRADRPVRPQARFKPFAG
jgi:hypothetical protein